MRHVFVTRGREELQREGVATRGADGQPRLAPSQKLVARRLSRPELAYVILPLRESHHWAVVPRERAVVETRNVWGEI